VAEKNNPASHLLMSLIATSVSMPANDTCYSKIMAASSKTLPFSTFVYLPFHNE
jgi:hypothetical protein